MWPGRWPAIALQSCIDAVEGAPPDGQAEVKWNLPCAECPEQTRCLNAKRKELGGLLYDREILTKPRTSESSLFPQELFEPCLRRGESLVKFWHKPFMEEHRYGVCSAWDIAWSEKIGGDWMVKMTASVDRQTGERRILDILRVQKLTFDQQVDLIASEWGKYMDDLVVIESDAAQNVWTQHVNRNTAVPVLPHSAGGKTDLATGVPSLLIGLEQRKWIFPWTPGTWHHENMQVFLGEAEAFGWVDGKLQGVGEHDDTVMAWFHLEWGLKRLLGQQHQLVRRNVVPGRRM